MTVKIGVPNLDIYDFLIENYSSLKDKYSLQLFRDSEENLFKHFLNNKIDIVILSPLSYGKGMARADFRIFPGACLACESYTGAASIYFNRNCNGFQTLASPCKDDFLTIASRIILAERYNSFPEVIQSTLSLEDNIKKYDTALVLDKSTGNDFALDLSEQWFDTYEFPLPLGFWVCKAEDHPEHTESILRELSDIDKREVQIVDNMEVNGNLYSREGYLLKSWNDDIENSLFQTLQLLYMLQIYEDIPAVKVFGRD